MALARAVAAGLLVFLGSVVVGHSTAAPPPNPTVVRAAPTTTTSTTVAPTTSTAAPPLRTSRQATHPRVAPAAATDEQQAEAVAEICAYDWPCGQAVKIASCESGLRWWATNTRSTARGIFQILGGPLDLKLGVALAHHMWTNRGFQPWAASKRCWA